MSIRNALRGMMLCAAVILLLLGSSASRAAPASAGALLPPRPTVAPLPIGASQPSEVVGATLRLDAAVPSAWQTCGTATLAVVQWQDSGQGWHDVDGWRGYLPAGVPAGTGVKWWVSPKDFGSGPFRWLIADGCSSATAVSESFSLPSAGGMTLTVKVNP
jgi:hypothetical protein